MNRAARYVWLGAAGLYAVAALVFLAPVLLRSDVVIFGQDTLTEEYPMYWWGWSKVRETGEIPWWCPHLFGGYPFVASFSFCPFYPPQWISLLLRFPEAFNWQYFLAFWMAGCCGYGGLRLAGWGRGAALAGGLLWMTCGHLTTLVYPGHLKKLQALAWVPLVWGGVAGGLNALPGGMAPGADGRCVACSEGTGKDSGAGPASAGKPAQAGDPDQSGIERPAGRYSLHRAVICFTFSGIGLAMQLLAHHFQIFYFSAILVGAYWLRRLLAGEAGSGVLSATSWRARRRTGLWGGVGLVWAVMLSVGLSAVQMFPSIHMAGLSNRAGGLTYDEATVTSYPPEEILEMLLPGFQGYSVRGTPRGSPAVSEDGKVSGSIADYRVADLCRWILPVSHDFGPVGSAGVYLGRWNKLHPERLVSDYPGIAMWALALLGLMGAGRREKWFWAAVFLMTFGVATGSYSPLFDVCWRVLPLFDRFRSPGTTMFLMSFSLVMLAVAGLEVLTACLGDDRRRRSVMIWFSALAASGAVLLMLALVRGVQSLQALGGMSGRPDGPWGLRGVFFWISAGRSGFYVVAVSLLIVAGLALQNRWKTRPGRAVIGGGMIVALLGVSTLDLWDNARRFIQAEPYAPYAAYLFHTPPDDVLARHPQPFRALQVNNELAVRFLGRGLNSTHGYHPVTFQRYFDLLRGAWFYDPLFVHLYNQQYVLARESVPIPEGYELQQHIGGYKIARWAGSLRHVWSPARLKVCGPGPEAALAAMRDALKQGEFYDTAFLTRRQLHQIADTEGVDEDTLVRAVPRPEVTAEVLVYDAGKIVLTARTPQKGWLLLSEHAAPGWIGRWEPSSPELTSSPFVQRPLTANYFFQLWTVPPGEHTLTLRYDPPLARAGAVVSVLAVMITVWIFVVLGHKWKRTGKKAETVGRTA